MRRIATILAVALTAVAVLAAPVSAVSAVTEADYAYMVPLGLGTPQVVGLTCVMPMQIVAPGEDLVLTVIVTNNDARPIRRATVVIANAAGAWRMYELDLSVAAHSTVSRNLVLPETSFSEVGGFTLAVWHTNVGGLPPSASWFGVWFLP